MATSSRPTREEILSVLDYEPKTGVFRWRSRLKRPTWWTQSTSAMNSWTPEKWNRRWAGKIAGTPNCRTGEIVMRFGKGDIKAHHIAWLVSYGEWPSSLLDHKNGNVADNRIANLRAATASQNVMNGKLRSTNKSGYKGVHYRPESKKNPWRACITVNYKRQTLGHFPSPEAAYLVYCAAARELHGEFARPERRQI